jgi:hypothetical protein
MAERGHHRPGRAVASADRDGDFHVIPKSIVQGGFTPRRVLLAADPAHDGGADAVRGPGSSE